MSADNHNTFNKDKLDLYLKELAKEYKKTEVRTIKAEYLIAMKLMAGKKISLNL